MLLQSWTDSVLQSPS